MAAFEVVPENPTRKFARATGSWMMDALTKPFVLGSDDPIGYWWDAEGKLKFRQGGQ
ncbi:MAG TPA: hypothetical protein VH120_16390 [Gemmataceae bacterium]|nr:hypothetical protein [Gemmataceae bacterium]